MPADRVDLALRLDLAARRLARGLPVGRQTRGELGKLLLAARAAVLEANPAADPRAAFDALLDRLTAAGIDNVDLVTWFNTAAERNTQPTRR